MKSKNSFYIGDVLIPNNLVLAPIAGTTNPSYIKLCEEYNLGYAITELISSEAIVRGNIKTLAMLNGIENINIPIAVQIFGSNPQTLAKSAQILVAKFNVKIIDINMGCPVFKVAIKNNAGSALLKDPKKIGEIVKTVSNAVSIPVTVKIRSGWDETSINAVEVAKICEENGAKAITIHARTRLQGYSGTSDLEIIKKVKESVSIPVIGNGDIKTPEDAKKMLEITNCDALMIGRASIGNPWIFKECFSYLEDNKVIPKPTNQERINTLKHHYNLLKENTTKSLALLEIRTQALAYLKGMPDAKIYKEKICKVASEEEFYNVLEHYEKHLKEII